VKTCRMPSRCWHSTDGLSQAQVVAHRPPTTQQNSSDKSSPHQVPPKNYVINARNTYQIIARFTIVTPSQSRGAPAAQPLPSHRSASQPPPASPRQPPPASTKPRAQGAAFHCSHAIATITYIPFGAHYSCATITSLSESLQKFVCAIAWPTELSLDPESVWCTGRATGI
jgi:hypothetical protein